MQNQANRDARGSGYLQNSPTLLVSTVDANPFLLNRRIGSHQRLQLHSLLRIQNFKTRTLYRSIDIDIDIPILLIRNDGVSFKM